MRLKIASIIMDASTSLETERSAETEAPTQPAPQSKPRVVSRQQVYFTVYPEGRDHLDLETGEVFENPSYARIRNEADKSISAQLSVYEASSELKSKLAYNRMQYFGEKSGYDYYDPSIHFSFVLPPRDFQRLLTNIQNGVLPTTVQIDLDMSHPLSYGWARGGSVKWRNKAEGKIIKIESIAFRYEILKEAFDSDAGETMAPDSTSAIEIVNQRTSELKDKLTEVITQIKYLGWIVIAAAFLILIVLSGHVHL
jgi:hypothetical protein